MVDYLFSNQHLFGPMAPAHVFPLIHCEVSSGPPLNDGLNRRCAPDKQAAAMAVHQQQLRDGIIEVVPRERLKHILAHVYIWKDKQAGSVRATLDCSGINGRIQRFETVLPDMRKFYEMQHGCWIFSDIDVRDQFFTFRFDDSTANNFGFLLPDASAFARYRGMVMGLHNAPGIAQEMTARYIVAPLRAALTSLVLSVVTSAGTAQRPRHEVHIYADNFTLATRNGGVRPAPGSLAECELALQHWREAVVPFLNLCSSAGYRFKVKGLSFATRESTALGVICDGVTIRLDPARTAGFSTMTVDPASINAALVHHYRGLFGFYRPFVGTLQYVKDIHLYTELLVTMQRTKQRASSLWTAEHTAAFYRLRDALLEAMRVYVPDYTRPLYLQCDASNEVGWAGTLFQYDERGYPCPICIFAYRWQDTLANRDTKCKEGYAMVGSMRLIAKMRLPTETTIRTDHINLLKMRISDDRRCAGGLWS